jgi:hypothetical protein
VAPRRSIEFAVLTARSASVGSSVPVEEASARSWRPPRAPQSTATRMALF